MSQFTVTCPLGSEEVLLSEIRGLGIQRTKTTRGAVQVHGKLKQAYTVCLWSRVASRVLWELKRFEALTGDELYDGLRSIPWQDHIDAEGTLWVDFNGKSKHIRNETFGAQKSKDAIVDALREACGARPSIQKVNPDVRVHIRLHHGLITAQIDLSGRPLHARTPEKHITDAPLKENLAATMLYLADWPRRAREGQPMMDPMCGSGTIALEAAEMARGRAPGLRRTFWGFENWRKHQPNTWKKLKDQAVQQEHSTQAVVYASDLALKAVQATRHNASLINLLDVEIQQRDVMDLQVPSSAGLLLTNPPYGTRLSTIEAMSPFYSQLGDLFKGKLDGWDAYVFCPANILSKSIGLKTQRRHPLMNGAIDCRLLHFPIRGRNT